METRLATMEVSMGKLTEMMGKLLEDKASSTQKNMSSGKINLPKFKRENVTRWIYIAKKYFKCLNTSDAERLEMIIFAFEGIALEWLQQTDDNLQFSSWSDLCDEILKRFGTSEFAIPTRRLSKLVQTG